jgi:nicotinamide-nucleotide amidase
MASRVAPAPAPVVPPHTAALLAIGDEVLRGEVANTNAAFLADHLFDAGLDVRDQRVVADEAPAIRRALTELVERAAVILVTGGLGPTEDDRTVDVVAELMGVGVETHTPSLEAMKKRYSAHGFELTPNNLRQVRVPQGAEAMPNGAGIAPGFMVRWAGSTLFFMPGVPREVERVFLDHVAPKLQTYMAAQGVPAASVRTWHIYGMGESHVDHRLAGLLNGIPDATLHFRTDGPENHVKVVIRGSEKQRNQELLEQVDRELRKRIGTGIYGIDGDTFPKVIGRTLREANATLALAESCTGGEAGGLLTSEPGASDFFLGGVVAYANDVKINTLGVKAFTITEAGAVSEACAKEMAEGVRRITNATVGISITGVAGPVSDKDRGKPNEKPVGTVCFGVATVKSAKAISKFFSGDRERIRRAAAYFALDLARRQIQ